MTWEERFANALEAFRPMADRILPGVAEAAVASGVVPGDAVKSFRELWYQAWIAKYVDEAWFAEQRERLGEPYLAITGLQLVRDAVLAGRGAVLAGLHIGPHGVPLLALDRMGVPLVVLMHPDMAREHPPFEVGRVVSSQPGVLVQLVSALRKGEIVATYVDVTQARSGAAPMSFADIATGASELAELCKLTDTPCYTWLVGQSDFDLRGNRRLAVEVSPVRTADGGRELARWAWNTVVSRPADWSLLRFLGPPLGTDSVDGDS